jgi:hypothetical protein
MIGNSFARAAHTSLVFAVIVSLWGCAAPDARPATEEEKGAPAGEPLWGLGFGEAATDQHCFDVALDQSTDTVVATVGFFGSLTIPMIDTFTATPARNVAVVKYAASGSQALWAKPIYATAEITRTTVDVDFQGNTIVAGGFNGTLTIPTLSPTGIASDFDAFIAKFDPAGNPLWVHTFGELLSQFVTDVATDGEGNIIVVGLAEGVAYKFGKDAADMDVTPPASTAADIFVAKFDSAGKVVWAKRVGLAGSPLWYDPTVSVAVSRTDGSIIVGGSHGDTLDFAPQQVALVGVQDGFVVKLDAQGEGLWQMQFGDKDRAQRVTNVAYTPSGEVFLTGWFSGAVSLGGEILESHKLSADLLVAKLDANGQHVWSRGYGHLGTQMGSSVTVDEKGRAIVLGSFTGDLEFFGKDTLINTALDTTSDIFAVKFSANGTPFWGRSYGDLDPMKPDNQTVGGAVLWKESGGEDRVIIVGMNRGTIDLGEAVTPLASQGAEDAFMMSITH